MQTIFIEKTADVRDNLKLLSQKLNVKLSLEGRKLSFDGDAVDEFTAEKVFEAIQFGFSVKEALPLVDTDMEFVKINIKNATRRKNLEEVRSRIIGKEGKTKRTLENISNCSIVVNNNEVGIIGYAESIQAATTGLKNIIKGSKQSNVYSYMERMNSEKKKHSKEDLGIKDSKDKNLENEKENYEEDEDDSY